MQLYPVDPKARPFWRSYPLRIPGGSTCSQCRQETVLVQSMKGGFITRNCPKCGNVDSLPRRTFKQLGLWIACPKCKARMNPEVLPDKNYGYVCKPCDVAVPLFELLPRYEEI